MHYRLPSEDMSHWPEEEKGKQCIDLATINNTNLHHFLLRILASTLFLIVWYQPLHILFPIKHQQFQLKSLKYLRVLPKKENGQLALSPSPCSDIVRV